MTDPMTPANARAGGESPAADRTPLFPHSTAWLPIATAPRDGTEVLAWDGEAHVVARWYPCPTYGPNSRDLGWWLMAKDFNKAPTHWCALPAPPEVTP